MPVLSVSASQIKCGSNVDAIERPIELSADVLGRIVKLASRNGGTLSDRDVRILQTLRDTWAGNGELVRLIAEIERHGTVYVRML